MGPGAVDLGLGAVDLGLWAVDLDAACHLLDLRRTLEMVWAWPELLGGDRPRTCA